MSMADEHMPLLMYRQSDVQTVRHLDFGFVAKADNPLLT